MTNSDFEYWSCERKRRYATAPQETPRMKVYACALCGGWHMATRRKWGDVEYNDDGRPIVPVCGS